MGPMKSLVKKHDVMVALNDQDHADLSRAAKRESIQRGRKVGRAELLREFAMPRVRELAQMQQEPAA